MLNIEAEASVDGGDPRILQSIPLTAARLPLAVIHYVARTRSSIVIHDAQQPGDQVPGLNQDPYIKERGIRSVLCLPILTGNKEQSNLIGILYLENNRASSTFTQERFDTLEIICLSAAGRLELSRKAVVDGLTGLFNHDYFQNLMSQEFASARRHGPLPLQGQGPQPADGSLSTQPQSARPLNQFAVNRAHAVEHPGPG